MLVSTSLGPLQANLTRRFMAYLSTPCTDAFTGKKCISKAIDALFSTKVSNDLEDHLEKNSEENKESVKPTLLWSCVYVQEIIQVRIFHSW